MYNFKEMSRSFLRDGRRFKSRAAPGDCEADASDLLVVENFYFHGLWSSISFCYYIDKIKTMYWDNGLFDPI